MGEQFAFSLPSVCMSTLQILQAFVVPLAELKVKKLIQLLLESISSEFNELLEMYKMEEFARVHLCSPELTSGALDTVLMGFSLLLTCF